MITHTRSDTTLLRKAKACGICYDLFTPICAIHAPAMLS